MVWLKGCPRCTGDLYFRRDTYGWYRSCLQCGYLDDPESSKVAMSETSSSPRLPEAAKYAHPKLPGSANLRRKRAKLAA